MMPHLDRAADGIKTSRPTNQYGIYRRNNISRDSRFHLGNLLPARPYWQLGPDGT